MQNTPAPWKFVVQKVEFGHGPQNPENIIRHLTAAMVDYGDVIIARPNKLQVLDFPHRASLPDPIIVEAKPVSTTTV